jgi:hypothetical protein
MSFQSPSPMDQSLESIFYFISNTGIFTACGQIGGNSGDCICDPDKEFQCANCFRWQGGLLMEVFANYGMNNPKANIPKDSTLFPLNLKFINRKPISYTDSTPFSDVIYNLCTFWWESSPYNPCYGRDPTTNTGDYTNVCKPNQGGSWGHTDDNLWWTLGYFRMAEYFSIINQENKAIEFFIHAVIVLYNCYEFSNMKLCDKDATSGIFWNNITDADGKSNCTGNPVVNAVTNLQYACCLLLFQKLFKKYETSDNIINFKYGKLTIKEVKTILDSQAILMTSFIKSLSIDPASTCLSGNKGSYGICLAVDQGKQVLIGDTFPNSCNNKNLPSCLIQEDTTSSGTIPTLIYPYTSGLFLYWVGLFKASGNGLWDDQMKDLASKIINSATTFNWSGTQGGNGYLISANQNDIYNCGNTQRSYCCGGWTSSCKEGSNGGDAHVFGGIFLMYLGYYYNLLNLKTDKNIDNFVNKNYVLLTKGINLNPKKIGNFRQICDPWCNWSSGDEAICGNNQTKKQTLVTLSEKNRIRFYPFNPLISDRCTNICLLSFSSINAAMVSLSWISLGNPTPPPLPSPPPSPGPSPSNKIGLILLIFCGGILLIGLVILLFIHFSSKKIN